MTNQNTKRIAITQAVMDLLDDWKIRTLDQIKLLALPEKIRSRHLRQYHEGEPFPESNDIDVRIEHLAGIADALRTTYPRNAQMATFWLNKNNQRFQNRSPLAVMLEDGIDGFELVRAHLDCAWDWHMDSKKSGNTKS
jgi:hypothetical protein